jgi:5-deoxy-glucuronate isomerase
MTSLLVRPQAPNSDGRVINVTPANAGWTYVGFDLYELAAGDTLARETGSREVALVLIDGKAQVAAGGQEFGEIGERMDVFEHKKPWTVYAPNDSNWSVQATTRCTLAVCSAPGLGNHPVRLIKPDDVSFETRGKGANTRHIHPILMEDSKWADSLLVTEVYTPSGNWSSYPPHRHDEDALPDISFLEETYYHRLNPRQGYAHHRVYTDIGNDGTRELDETMTVADGDVTLVPKGYHPCAAPYGYELYYLNVMAGPLRTWRFQNDPDHDWIFQRDKA